MIRLLGQLFGKHNKNGRREGSIPASTAFEWENLRGCLDRVEGAPLPIARAFGWFDGQSLPPMHITTDAGRILSPSTSSRLRREDVVAARASDLTFSGFIAEFLLEDDEQPTHIEIGSSVIAVENAGRFSRVRPHYDGFFAEKRALGREHVYGSGPPTDVSDEFKQFALFATGKTLDFGCGNSDLLMYLRSHGRDAEGLELDEERIRAVLDDARRCHVTLYPGGCPLPFDSCSFDTIVSTEVIEHIIDIETYVPELARILVNGGTLIVTTPDITAIPSSFPTGTVPWHLLESTHVRFFTPKSVEALFSTHFRLKTLVALGHNRVNGLYVPGSIGAVFVKR